MLTIVKRTLLRGQQFEAVEAVSDKQISAQDVRDVLGPDALAYGLKCWWSDGKWRGAWTENATQELIDAAKNHKHVYGPGRTVGRCLTRYTCEICGDYHEIDSGD